MCQVVQVFFRLVKCHSSTASAIRLYRQMLMQVWRQRSITEKQKLTKLPAAATHQSGPRDGWAEHDDKLFAFIFVTFKQTSTLVLR